MNYFLIRLTTCAALAALVIASPLPMYPQPDDVVVWKAAPPGMVRRVYSDGSRWQISMSSSSSARNSPEPETSLPKVVPYREPDSRPWYAKMKSPFSTSEAERQHASSNRAMARMIKKRPPQGEIDAVVRDINRRPIEVNDISAIKLPEGEKLGSQALAVMTRKGKPFYAMDNNRRVWLFNTKEDAKLGKHFTYNGKLKSGNDKIVIDALERGVSRGLEAIRHVY